MLRKGFFDVTSCIIFDVKRSITDKFITNLNKN